MREGEIEDGKWDSWKLAWAFNYPDGNVESRGRIRSNLFDLGGQGESRYIRVLKVKRAIQVFLLRRE